MSRNQDSTFLHAMVTNGVNRETSIKVFTTLEASRKEYAIRRAEDNAEKDRLQTLEMVEMFYNDSNTPKALGAVAVTRKCVKAES